MTAITDACKYTTREAPTSAPVVVAISKNIPMRILEYPSRT
jgi:hypothetical protein